jgi:pimeloyl-ACP methyl ester carboxylesterase
MSDIKNPHPFKFYNEVYGEGPPILCLHGFGGNVYAWRHLIAPLSAKHKLILIDLKGFGASPKPRDRHYSIEDHANLVFQFILEQDFKNLILIGHSFGGVVALFTALKLRRLNLNRLSSLVLINSVAYPQRYPMFIRLLRAPIIGSLGLHLRTTAKNVLPVLELGYYDSSKITKDQVSAYTKPIKMEGGRQALIQTARQIIPPNVDKLSEEYKIIEVPTLILWGRQDKIIPLEIGERLHQTMPNSQFAVIDECGHNPHEEKPDDTVSIISSFLSTYNL